MFVWCMYCQHFIEERAPFTDYSVTHGVCRACYDAGVFQQKLSRDTKRLASFYAKLRQSALAGDLDTAERYAKEALAAGFNPLDVALGFIQPALYEIGDRWERGEITYHDEHRFTAWCARLLALLSPVVRPRKVHPDLMIVQAPGNEHILGPHLAALALADRGFDIRIVQPAQADFALADMLDRLAPRAVGFSCALPEMIGAARVQGEFLRNKGFRGPLLLGGVACRRTASAPDSSPAPCTRELSEAAAMLDELN